jgi:glutamate dehydrogenase
MNDSTSRERYLQFLAEEIDRRAPEKQAGTLKAFAAEVLAGVDFEDLRDRDPADLYGTIFYAWQFLQEYDGTGPKVSLFNPNFEQHGWQSRHTAILVLTDGIPFAAESVRLEINRRNITIHRFFSTDLVVQRDARHGVKHLYPATIPTVEGKRRREAVIYLEVSRITDAALLADIKANLELVLADVNVVVGDFEPMCERLREVIGRFGELSDGLDENDWKENRDLLQWLLADNFTFLGFEELQVQWHGRRAKVSTVPGSRLGLLRGRETSGCTDLSQEIAEASSPERLWKCQVVFFKSSRRSRVHRIAYPDYISVKRFDAKGRVAGQYRILGLFTAVVYTMDPDNIPIVRRKVSKVIEMSRPMTSSHRERTLQRVLEVLPRDELFQSDIDTLYQTAIRVFHIQERRRIRLFIRPDRRHRFVSCLVYWPRDIYRTELRQKIERLLMEAVGAEESEFTTFFSESVLVRTHFVMRLGPGQEPDYDAAELEQLIVRVAQQWEDQLQDTLTEEFGEELGAHYFGQYRYSFPAGYRDDYESPVAAADIRRFSELENDDQLAVHLYRNIRDPEQLLHFRLIREGSSIELSDVIPMFENLGMRVLGERPYQIRRADRRVFWVHDFSLVYALAEDIDVPSVSAAVEDAFLAVIAGRAESDGFNRLIVGTHLRWREVAILRAYAHYMKQLRYSYSQQFIAETLGRHLGIASALIRLFMVRFDPSLTIDHDQREAEQQAVAERILGDLEKVEQLNEDRVLRACLALINATLRTNYFQRDSHGAGKDYFSFKLDCQSVPGMPRPVPRYEIYVYSPRMEGVHLRRGKVARGGLRWSDRLEDFRTEILGLVKAQQVKNAVIVPVGAKGGFVLKQLKADAPRDAVLAEGVACYRTFVQGLLDITDNIVDGKVVTPPYVVRGDDDDPYLVVAADKGTATFSDVANEISAQYDFWLRDAFASGGSIGYDHKEMGITARGAWVSVQRHFRELGLDTQSEDFTVVGIGDMSGDVFGNGMLQSRHIRLVAAFNHLHVFVDPDPDPELSYRERERLFSLPRSSWSDYDATLISPGGGVFSRAAKSVQITPEMRRVLGIEAERLTPAELISAILAAPVDLVWNGGIGTYFKASTETHADVGDKSNDAVRIDANQMRARVVGEGGNLGLTQLARIEFAVDGGACNTDFIDNSGGVDCSDHEVNIKILLNEVVVNGDMTEKQRAELLEDMTEDVAKLVLRNNYRQRQTISIAAQESLLRINEYRALVSSLEAHAGLDRKLEFLPGDDVLVERRTKGVGLTRPELAVLTCYVKGQLKQDILASDIPEDGYLARSLQHAFPARLAERFAGEMYAHKLRREIVATQLANDVVDLMGITFIERMTQSTSASVAEMVKAYVVARDIFDLHHWWESIEALDNVLPAASQIQIFTDLQRLLRLATRWFVRNRRGRLDPETEVGIFREPVRRIQMTMGTLALGEQKAAWDRRNTELLDLGLPAVIAQALAGSTMLLGALGMVDVACNLDGPIDDVARIAFGVNDSLGFYWFGKQITALRVDTFWQAMARESYLDELDWQVRSIVAWVMRSPGEGEGPSPRLEYWLENQKSEVERWRRLIDRIREAQTHDYAMYAVAVRGLLELAQSGSIPAQ